MLGPQPRADQPAGCGAALRADARRNRELILAAAREVFSERGLDASLNEVARRAGVGVATLFRRFPTREDLIAATFADRMNDYGTLIEAALADPDPWQGFCDYVRAICAMQVGDRGFTDLLTQSFPTAKEFEAQRDETFRQFVELIGRAKEGGRLRADFVPEDLPMLLMANAGVVSATGGDAPQASPRLVAYLLQAFDARAVDPLPEPPTPRGMYRAFRRLHAPGRAR
jgi:AcrR family transcriptional regulator